MKTTLYLLLILPFFSLAQSSNSINANDFRAIQEQQYVNLNSRGKVSLDNIDGSPFITDNFIKGKIIDTKKDIEIAARIKYNGYLDEFLIKLDDENQNFKLPRVERYEYLYKGKRFFILINDKLFKDTGNKYVVKLVNRPELKLYKQYKAKLNPGREARNSYDSGERPGFYRDDQFYIRIADNDLKRLNTERKNFAAQFPANYRADMEDFVYDKKLKFKKETLEFDVLRAMRFYLKIRNK